MSIQEIIFNIINSNARLWVRYWVTREPNDAFSSRGEFVQLRASFITDTCLKELLEAGFKIERIETQKINADAYSDVLLKRELQYPN